MNKKALMLAINMSDEACKQRLGRNLAVPNKSPLSSKLTALAAALLMNRLDHAGGYQFEIQSTRICR
jgi:hypothetical protein